MAGMNGPAARAGIIVIDSDTYGTVEFKAGDRLDVQFNPEEYSVSRQMQGASKTKGSGKEKEDTPYDFKTPEPKSLQVKLYFDGSLQGYLEAAKDRFEKSMTEYGKKYNSKQDVNKLYVNKLFALLERGTKSGQPPRIVFVWGSTSFKGYASSLQVHYKRFNANGEPTRAEIDLSIRGLDGDEAENREAGKSGTQPEMLTGDEPMGLGELFG